MSYKKQIGKIMCFPIIITPKNNTDGTYSINPAGEIVQQGTPMSADNFNHLEQGVYDADKNAADALSKIGFKCRRQHNTGRGGRKR